jgi:hypothetical protein
LRWQRLQVIERLPIKPSAMGGGLASFRCVTTKGAAGGISLQSGGVWWRDMDLLLYGA